MSDSQEKGEATEKNTINLREGLQHILQLISQLDAEEQERISHGLHPLFGLGEPLLTVRRNLGAALETVTDSDAGDVEAHYLQTIHTLLNLMRGTKGQLPEDTESLERVIAILQSGIENIGAYQGPNNAALIESVRLDLLQITSGLRKRLDFLAEYLGHQLPM